MNIYEMYKENNNKAGFWVIRGTWGNTIAKVTMIGEQTSGKLRGRHPYYGNVDVFCEFYELKTGKKIQNKISNQDKDGKTLLSCPGTYRYRMIDPNLVLENYGSDFWLSQEMRGSE